MGSVCTKYCDGCHYRKTLNGAYQYCDYFLDTGKRRPCPAGDGCTVKVTRTVYRKKKRERTPEEQAAFEAKRKAQDRAKHKAYYQKNKERIIARNKQWKEKNREHLKAYQKEYRRKKKEE